jgi:hypothetical protein
MESVIVPAEGQKAITKELTPRAASLLRVMPAQMVSPMFRQIYGQPVPRDNEHWYLDLARKNIEAVPKLLRVVGSKNYAHWSTEAVYQIPNAAAREIILDRPVHFILYALLSSSTAVVQSGDIQVLAKGDVVRYCAAIHDAMYAKPEIAQFVLHAIIFAICKWELEDMMHLIKESLHMPTYVANRGPGIGLLYVGCHGDRKRRQRAYEELIQPRHRPLSFEEFEHVTQPLRRSTMMTCVILSHLASHLPLLRAQQEFAKAVYPDWPVLPDDLGRQALLFCTRRAVEGWKLMGYPRSPLIQARLVELGRSRWMISCTDLGELLYMR